MSADKPIEVFAELAKILSTVKLEPVYAPLLRAGVLAAVDAQVAMDDYRKSRDDERLCKDLINAAMDFTQQWERWIDSLEAPQLKHPASKTLHSFLLRYSKGILKACRIWRIDLRK